MSPAGPSRLARTVGVAIAEYADADGGSCYPSQATIAKDAACTPRSVRNAVSELSDSGWLEVGRRSVTGRAQGEAWASEYRLTLPEEPERGSASLGEEPEARSGSHAEEPERGSASYPEEPETHAEEPERGSGDLVSTKNNNTITSNSDSTGESAQEDREPPSPAPAELWTVWLDELGGSPPLPRLTDSRRKKLAAWRREQAERFDDPVAGFRAVCRALQASDHHMAKRAYQLPESFLRNAERRDKWTLEALENGTGGQAYDGRAELDAMRKAGA